MFRAIAGYILGGIINDPPQETMECETQEMNDWLVVNKRDTFGDNEIESVSDMELESDTEVIIDEDDILPCLPTLLTEDELERDTSVPEFHHKHNQKEETSIISKVIWKDNVNVKHNKVDTKIHVNRKLKFSDTHELTEEEILESKVQLKFSVLDTKFKRARKHKKYSKRGRKENVTKTSQDITKDSANQKQNLACTKLQMAKKHKHFNKQETKAPIISQAIIKDNVKQKTSLVDAKLEVARRVKCYNEQEQKEDSIISKEKREESVQVKHSLSDNVAKNDNLEQTDKAPLVTKERIENDDQKHNVADNKSMRNEELKCATKEIIENNDDLKHKSADNKSMRTEKLKCVTKEMIENSDDLKHNMADNKSTEKLKCEPGENKATSIISDEIIKDSIKRKPRFSVTRFGPAKKEFYLTGQEIIKKIVDRRQQSLADIKLKAAGANAYEEKIRAFQCNFGTINRQLAQILLPRPPKNIDLFFGKPNNSTLSNLYASYNKVTQRHFKTKDVVLDTTNFWEFQLFREAIIRRVNALKEAKIENYVSLKKCRDCYRIETPPIPRCMFPINGICPITNGDVVMRFAKSEKERIQEIRPCQKAQELNLKKHIHRSQLKRQNQNYTLNHCAKTNRLKNMQRNHSSGNNTRRR